MVPNMHSPKAQACCLAVFAALAASSANAVHLSPNGTGQVLIFPYYTVRNGFATLISIDNTQDNIKAVKLRFREGLNGRDVLNFNLFLAPNDTWTGAVVETINGARLVTNDNSCVAPADLFTEVRSDGVGLPLNAFKNYYYSGSNFKDAESLASLDRTREGYFEVLEMGVIEAGLSPSAALIVGYVKPAATSGVPANCAGMDRYDGYAGNPNSIRFPDIGEPLLSPPTGGLRGRASLIGASSGTNFSFSPTALDAWSSRVAYSNTGDIAGTQLGHAFPATSTVATPAGMIVASWSNGTDAVSAVLMRATLTNEFVLDSGTNSQTDWLITFPTKPYYVGVSTDQNLMPSPPPFATGFNANGTGSCDGYDSVVVSREAITPVREVFAVGVLPPGYVDPNVSNLCWVANVLPFANATTPSILGALASNRLSGYVVADLPRSTTTAGAATTPALRGVRQGPNGKFTVRFNGAKQRLTPTSAVLVSASGATSKIPGTHFGLPAIGVMLHNYQNNNVASKYGGVLEHSYSVRVE